MKCIDAKHAMIKISGTVLGLGAIGMASAKLFLFNSCMNSLNDATICNYEASSESVEINGRIILSAALIIAVSANYLRQQTIQR